MIATIQGTLSECSALQAIIEINGLGYEVNIPLTTTEKLPSIGKTVKLYTVAIYREDIQALYGFHDKETRELFRLFVEKVSGIGPKTALGILSHLSVPTLKAAVAQQNIALLSKCPGIGKKTAERLVVELKDLIARLSPSSTSMASPLSSSMKSPSLAFSLEETSSDFTIHQDAIAALVALGYKPADADKSVRKVLSSLSHTPTTAELIKAALNN